MLTTLHSSALIPDVLARLSAALADRYRLAHELGAGGMATVYLAQDLRHDRRVAIKVLRPELSAILGGDRFLGEIRVTAHLQHPHILPLYDSGSVDGLLYYVMPYVEGESLRQKLAREKQLPLEESIGIAQAVASALDYAHRHGVIHRDIKPENILLHEGQALVADFGIALALRSAAGNRLTETGLSLGTPHYMSPEQAAGDRELDGRTDVYSLGCVAYEMLAGEPPHTGATAQAVITKIVTETAPSVRKARPAAPVAVELAIGRALERLAADRFGTAGEFAEALVRPGVTAPGQAAGGGGPERQSRRLQFVAIGGAVLGLVGIVVGIASLRGPPATTPTEPRYWNIVLPDSAPLVAGRDLFGNSRRALALSPDGRVLVYVGGNDAARALYRVRLDAGTVEQLPGTEGAYFPFFSPDGLWVGFFAGEELRKLSVEGGVPVRLGRVSDPLGAAWAPGDRILVLELRKCLGWFPAGGGEFVPIQRSDKRPICLFGLLSDLLPGGEWVVIDYGRLLGLVSIRTGEQKYLTATRATPVDSTSLRDVLTGSDPRYLRSGYLIFLAGNTLMAAPFNADRLVITGPVRALVNGARREAVFGEGQTAVSADGNLVYAPGDDGAVSRLVLASRDGRVLDTLQVEGADVHGFRASPDGTLLALSKWPSSGLAETWIIDLARRLPERVPGNYIEPLGWSRDGRFVLGREGGSLSVGVELEALAPSKRRVFRNFVPMARLQEGSRYAGRSIDSSGRDGLWLREASDSTKRRLVAEGVTWYDFSPNGSWLTYVTDGGLYATRTAPDGERRVTKIAPAGADEPRWAARGNEIVYRVGSRWFAVPITGVGDSLGFSEPKLMFQGNYQQALGASFDLLADGRLVLLLPTRQPPVRQLNVITNLFTLLRQRAGAPDTK